MATILLGNEMGEGLGHAKPLRTLADALHQRGHKIILAIPDVATAAPSLQNTPYPVIAAPRVLRNVMPGKTTYSYADLLVSRGFGDTHILSAMTGAWQ